MKTVEIHFQNSVVEKHEMPKWAYEDLIDGYHSEIGWYDLESIMRCPDVVKWLWKEGYSAMGNAGIETIEGIQFAENAFRDSLLYDQYLSEVKDLILDDLHRGVLSWSVRSFSDLHEYVDANEYLITIHEKTGKKTLSENMRLLNRISEDIDEWIKGDRLR